MSVRVSSGRGGAPGLLTRPDTGRPTLADVAKRAGVSGQTVSRVVHGAAVVTRETAARVQLAIDELGYRPNGAARALKAGRTNTVGVVTADSTLHGSTSLLYAVERAVRAAGFFVSIASVSLNDRAEIVRAARWLQSQGADGLLVLCAVQGRETVIAADDVDVPVVLAWAHPGGRWACASTDEQRAAGDITTYLLGLGHRTVHHVSGPADHPSTALRRQGWRSALTGAGAPVPAPLTGDWGAGGGYAAGRRLATDEGVTAVFCANDQTALGVLRALAEAGRAVPRTVSVVGFDGSEDSGFYQPPLTTVRIDFDRVGRRCVDLLRRQITDPDPAPPTVLLPAEIVLRSSHAAPSRRAEAPPAPPVVRPTRAARA